MANIYEELRRSTGIVGNANSDGISLTEIPQEKEEIYLLMRISKDLHFISTLFRIALTLGIIGGLIMVFGLMSRM